ncbi:hypothetical protein [Bacillus sp. UNC41MFS5]|uniref:hypothetical protein n=1 Tax=Bacillus sp. UNC41MFS5 TaxID=1449046 RepID=UPI00047C3016|nr:hypothetical protein [Bacillus sp. UNC41MFS5]
MFQIISIATLLTILFMPQASDSSAAGIVDTRGLVGFASVNGKVTGGESGQTVTVSNATDFLKYVKVSKPLVIKVSGRLYYRKVCIKLLRIKPFWVLGTMLKLQMVACILVRWKT